MCTKAEDVVKSPDLLDLRIKKTKELFFQELARKKRNIKRQWMEINAVTNTHFLQMLPYRSMLSHVHDLTHQRRLEMSYKIMDCDVPSITTECPSGVNQDEVKTNDSNQISGLERERNEILRSAEDQSDEEFSILPNETTLLQSERSVIQ